MKTYCFKKALLALAVTMLTVATAAAAPDLDTKISVGFRSAPVEDVLASIQEQTGLNFVYSSDLARKWPNVTIQARRRSAEEVIADLVSLIECQYTVKGNIVSISPQQLSGRTRNIKGYVRDENGDPLPGAPVSIGEARVLTITDNNGFYSFPIPVESTTLKFTYLGMTDTYVMLEPGDKDLTRNIEMQSNLVLDEVMVIAYGTTTKASFTGAAGKVDGDKLELIPSANPLNTLNGTTPGLRLTSANGQPGTEATITIRGIGSINGNNDPLIVLDGMIYSGNLATIPSTDIEQITVLKDAASTALYGARAANGVIMITTKQGKGEIPKINVKIAHGFVSREQKDYETMDLKGYMENYWQQLYNNSILDGKGKDEAARIASNTVVTSLGYSDNYYPWKGSVAIDNVVGTDGKYNPSAKMLWADDTDWIGATERVGQVQDYTISASGKGKYTSYFGSVNFLNNPGYMVGTAFERYTARANVSFEKKWLKFGVNSSASISDQSGNLTTSTGNISNPYHVVLKIVPTYPIHLHYSDGSYITNSAGEKLYDFGEGYVGKYDEDIPARNGFNYNVVAYQNKRFSHYNRNIINVKPFVEITFLKDFKLSANVALYNSNYRSHSATPHFPEYTSSSTSVTITQSQTRTLTANQLLTWNHAFGDHHLDALLGHETHKYTYDYETSGKKNQIIIGDNYQFNNYSISSSDPQGYKDTYTTEGYFARLNYDYSGRYFLSGSIRRDGSSKFYKTSRWGNFWSVGASWIISNEEFLRGNAFINMLKFRTSYGTVGNDLVGDGYYPWMGVYALKQNDTQPGYVQDMTSPGNLNLHWEVSKNWDAAIEFAAFLNRLTGSVEYFNRSSSELLMSVTLPSSSGNTSYPTNDGGLVNRGWELQLAYDIVKTKKATWNLGANASILKNKVTHLPIDPYTFNSDFNKMQEGHSVYEWWLYQWRGVDPATGVNYFELGDRFFKEDGSYIDGIADDADVLTIDGKYYTTAIAKSKEDFSGSSIPKVYGGITSDLSIGRFSLAINLYYQLGGKGYDRGYSNIMQQGTIGDNSPWINRHVDAAKSWTPENPSTEFAIWTTSTKALGSSTYAANTTATRSTRWLTNTNMLEINNITASYNFSKTVCNTLGIDGLRAFVSADHLYLLNSRRGYFTNYSLSNYTANASYSKPARTIMIGLDFTL
ncbi:MAG: SusC/RagA family TonB-linked outer membrane protein [Bacteroidales bacterium]|nr:SusC/RagA family TonB-linked outer membrane protein [Bacteroidales bacterium]